MNKDFTIKRTGIEVFRAGDYGGKGTYTVGDISAIADSYSKDKMEGRITLDHYQDGPKYGVVDRVYADGESLYIDMSISEEMDKMVSGGAYSDRSVEFVTDKSLSESGPYLSAVSFLGAARPQVKGMAPLQFSDNCRVTPLHIDGDLDNVTRFEMRNPSMETFSTTFPRPDGVTAGVLVDQGCSGMMLGHKHDFAVDAQGNGFTSVPCYCDEEYCSGEYADGGHQHLIVGGVIQPAEDDEGNAHTHDINKQSSQYRSFSDGLEVKQNKKAKDNTMPENNTRSFSEEEFVALKEQKADLEKKFSDSQNKVAEFEKKIASMEAGAEADKSYTALFNHKDGAYITPAQRDGFISTFSTLWQIDQEKAKAYADTFSSGNPVKFDESDAEDGDLGNKVDLTDSQVFSDEVEKEMSRLIQENPTLSYSDAFACARKNVTEKEGAK